VIIAVIILAIVIGYVFFARSGPAQQVGWNAPTVAAPAVSAPAEDAI
jgi:hypothetical protein